MSRLLAIFWDFFLKSTPLLRLQLPSLSNLVSENIRHKPLFPHNPLSFALSASSSDLAPAYLDDKILYIPVPHLEHLPFRAGRPFFIVTF